MTYEEMLERLFAHADEGYRAFHGKLLKNPSIKLIGVRMPVLRALAKEWKKELGNILTFPDEYYEVTFLKCACAGMLPFREFTAVIDGLVPLLDNWATCDCFTAPCIAKNREAFLPYIQKYLADEREFVRRYALVTLLHYYVEKEYLPLVYASVRTCTDEQYYVMMAAAWLIAEVAVKYYDDGKSWLKEKCFSLGIHNRAIQKARESFRLSKEQKEELKKLRR